MKKTPSPTKFRTRHRTSLGRAASQVMKAVKVHLRQTTLQIILRLQENGGVCNKAQWIRSWMPLKFRLSFLQNYYPRRRIQICSFSRAFSFCSRMPHLVQ